MLRHIVQILPIVVALVILHRSPAWGAAAALPIFGFWTAIAVLIWLFLLGLSRFASGHYTPIEIALTHHGGLLRRRCRKSRALLPPYPDH